HRQETGERPRKQQPARRAAQSRGFGRSDEDSGADHRTDDNHRRIDRSERANQTALLSRLAHFGFGALSCTPSFCSCALNVRAKSTAPGVSPCTQMVSARTSTSAWSTERTLPSRSIRTTRIAANRKSTRLNSSHSQISYAV